MGSVKIVLPEWEDERIIKAADLLRAEGIEILSPVDFKLHREAYRSYIRRRTFSRNWPDELIESFLDDPVNYGAIMLALGDADGMVAGVTTPKTEILRTAIRVLGVRKESRFVFSSIFLTAPDGLRRFSFADCSVVIEPKPLELATIAGNTALFHQRFTGEEAVVAFISFSTQDKQEHYRIERVQEAMVKFKRKFPQIRFAGEMQVDAAVNAFSADQKVGDPGWRGQANVLIFPNLDAGDVAWKITEQLAGYSVIGPKLYGLNGELNLVSRGCSIGNIINTVLLTISEREFNAVLQLQM